MIPSPISIDPPVVSELPLAYDVPAIEDYFAQRPGQLARRAVSLSRDVVSIAAQLLADAARAPRPPPSATDDGGNVAGTGAVNVDSAEAVRVLYWEGIWRERGAGVRQALERSGPTFVKFGQALASRVDHVGPVLAQELEQLQDRLQPFGTDEARAIIAAELLGDHTNDGDEGGSSSSSSSSSSSCRIIKAQQRRHAAEALLASLSPEPVAAASVSQVYRAELDAHLLQALLAHNTPTSAQYIDRSVVVSSRSIRSRRRSNSSSSSSRSIRSRSRRRSNSSNSSSSSSSAGVSGAAVALAVKVQRPTSRALVAADALLLRAAAKQLEALRWPDFWPLPKDFTEADGISVIGGVDQAEPAQAQQIDRRVVRANCVGAVDEFMSRLFEELDFAHEVSVKQQVGGEHMHGLRNRKAHHANVFTVH